MTTQADLIVRRPQGLYCPPGDFFIDPWRPVERAVITHAHADHARRGHGHYLVARPAQALLQARLGPVPVQTLDYGEPLEHRGVKVSLHPAGHVLGSAQVRVEYRGRVWVASGDYKVAADRTCAPFEPVRCDVFITESTFGLPIYRWAEDSEVFEQIHRWWATNASRGQVSVLLGYSLGKAQRLLAGLDPAAGPILVHPAVDAINQVYRQAGVDLPATSPLSRWTTAAQARQAGYDGALVLLPPQAATAALLRRLGETSTALASGWMQLRGARRRAGWDTGFALSDHADWPGLQSAIAATGAQRIIVTHGSSDVMVRHLGEQGLQAQAFETEYGPVHEAQEEPVQWVGLSDREVSPPGDAAAVQEGSS